MLSMDKNILYIGGGLAALLLLTNKSGSNPISNILSPSTSTTGYKDVTGNTVSVQPTAQQNADLLNPNHQLSSAELAQYSKNYLDVTQGMYQGWTDKYGSFPAALQAHWRLNGVVEHRTFLPLVTDYTVPYQMPPKTSDSGGGGWFSSALGIATSVLGLIAGNEDQTGHRFTDADIELLINGSAVAKELLPLFRNDAMYSAIDRKMNEVLSNIVS